MFSLKSFLRVSFMLKQSLLFVSTGGMMIDGRSFRSLILFVGNQKKSSSHFFKVLLRTYISAVLCDVHLLPRYLFAVRVDGGVCG